MTIRIISGGTIYIQYFWMKDFSATGAATWGCGMSSRGDGIVCAATSRTAGISEAVSSSESAATEPLASSMASVSASGKLSFLVLKHGASGPPSQANDTQYSSSTRVSFRASFHLPA
ncbi:hypothetical protein KL905_001866 [Ogataea polymorpha]|nr:hypothetical protein KL905_001866 [Ogataea polymorpha]